MTTEGPLVAVSLVTWNGLRWLPGCLASLLAQDLPGGFDAIELIVHDNGSTDGTLGWLKRALPDRAHDVLIEAPSNLGYAPAHDRNLELATAPAVLLLNQDVELDPEYLRRALAVLDARPDVAAVQGRILRLGAPGEHLGVLDTTGLVQHRDRRVVSRDQGVADGPAQDAAGPVWGVDGPAPVYRLAALRGARLPGRDGRDEILDRDFFAFKEDVDLSWRLRRLGWEAWYEPAAIAWHARGDSTTATTADLAALRRGRSAVPDHVKIRSWRNQRLSQLKNDPLRAMVRDVLPILRREAGSLVFTLLYDRAVLRAIPGTLAALPSALRKRRHLARLVRQGVRPGGRPSGPGGPPAR